MRAAIYGAGSLGTILGAFITKNGGKIELINRNKKHIEALKEHGAHVTGTGLHAKSRRLHHRRDVRNIRHYLPDDQTAA